MVILYHKNILAVNNKRKKAAKLTKRKEEWNECGVKEMNQALQQILLFKKKKKLKLTIEYSHNLSIILIALVILMG